MEHTSTTSLDELDFSVLSLLQKDGRMSFTVMAKETGASISTIRTRVTRLIEEGTIRIIGRVQPEKIGFNAYASIRISVRPANKIDHVVQELLKYREVSFLALISGDFDLEVDIMCRDNEHFIEVVNERISNIEGVYKTTADMYLKVLRYAQPDLNLVR